ELAPRFRPVRLAISVFGSMMPTTWICATFPNAMKPTTFIVGLTLLSVVGIGLFLALTTAPPNAPNFFNASPPASPTRISYDFLGPRPFESDKMWISTDAGTFVFDLEKRRVLGQIFNASPVMLFDNPPRLLFYPNSPRSRQLTGCGNVC